MRINRRSLIKGIGTTGAAVAIAGCIAEEGDDGDDGSDSGSALFWHDFQEAEEADLMEYIESFEEETGHEINDENLSELEDQLETSLPTGEGPDMFTWAHDWVGRYEDRGWLYDGSDDLTVDLEETYTGAGVDAVSWNGGVYGLPYGAETVALLYNRELVDGPPETLDEMVEVMEDHNDPAAGSYGVSYPLNDPYFVSAWVHAFGGYYYDAEADDLGLTLDETIEGVEVLMDSFEPYAPADPAYESQTAVFNDGNAPYAINGPWEVGGFRDAGVDVGVAPMPTVDGGDPAPYTGVQMFYFTQELEGSDDALAAARDFVEWYTTNEEIVVENADKHGYIPVHADSAESEELSEDTQAFARSVDMGTPMPAHPKMNQVWVPVEEALTRILNGDQGITEAFEQAEGEVRDAWDEQDY